MPFSVQETGFRQEREIFIIEIILHERIVTDIATGSMESHINNVTVGFFAQGRSVIQEP